MSRNIPLYLRVDVAKRAGFRCEYCLLPESYGIYPFEVDHIIAVKHGGKTVLGNLAYSCIRCNRMKGTDLTTLSGEAGEIVRLFNPRKDNWNEHFEVVEGAIYGHTDIGKATAQLLAFNNPERIIGRKLLIEAGEYP
ncbi:MAG: HNH endonuclease [Thermoanaerobaculia bacterium]|nr:HNH endonuclease [Thermoanaerobaculia bacterium]